MIPPYYAQQQHQQMMPFGGAMPGYNHPYMF
jgi:hypothetical protein